MQKAREVWRDTKDPSISFESFPYKAHIERSLLSGLINTPNNHQQAFTKVLYILIFFIF